MSRTNFVKLDKSFDTDFVNFVLFVELDFTVFEKDFVKFNNCVETDSIKFEQCVELNFEKK